MAAVNGRYLGDVTLPLIQTGQRDESHTGAAVGRSALYYSLGLQKTFRMRGWSSTYSTHVEWTAPVVDASGLHAPNGVGALTDIVLLSVA